MPRPKREPCQYPAHCGHDWRLKGRRHARGPAICGICHPPAEPLVEQGRVEWLNGGGPATPERTVSYKEHDRRAVSINQAADLARRAKVKYLHSRTAAWVARSRILGRAER